MRASATVNLARCPGFAALHSAEDDAGGPAAHTGSAVGRSIELWHRGGETGAAVEEALQRTRSEAEKFPLAEWDNVKLWTMLYAQDKRNRGVVLPDLCEAEVRLMLDPIPEDPVQEKIEIIGHVDQIRRELSGVHYVWDTKSGKPSGMEMCNLYAWQLAAYALACTATLGHTVMPGGIIRLRSYEGKAASSPFYATPWGHDLCREMLENVAIHVAMLHKGLVLQHPGPHCNWCPGESVQTCGDKIRRLPRIL